MNRPGHKTIALAASLGVCAALRPEPEHGAIIVALGQLTVMAPDKLETVKVLWWSRRIFGHRGPTHRLWAPVLFMAILALPVLMLENDAGERFLEPYWIPVSLGALCGYGSHLWTADALTKTGLPWRGRRLHLLPKRWRVTTAGGKTRGERRVRFLARVLIVVFAAILWPA